MKTTETNTRNNQEQMLSEHFSLTELTRSGTAMRMNIVNQPSAEDIERLRSLCRDVLEPLRRRFGVIRITSGYRCEALNTAVGGVKDSQHLRGEAADIHVSCTEEGHKFFEFIRHHCPFDQMLFERKQTNGCYWLHVSHRREKENRRQAFCVEL